MLTCLVKVSLATLIDPKIPEIDTLIKILIWKILLSSFVFKETQL